MNPKRILAALILAAVAYVAFTVSYWGWTVQHAPPLYPGGPFSSEAQGIIIASAIVMFADLGAALALAVFGVIWSLRTLSGKTRATLDSR